MNTYIVGALGSSAPQTNRAILVRLQNVPELMRSVGGSVAEFVARNANETTEEVVYDQVAQKIATSLSDKHVEATVEVVQPADWKSAGEKQTLAILVRVKNAAELARSQGAMASLAQALAPATIEAKVYSQIAAELQAGLAAQNVLATVTPVEPTAWKPAVGSMIWQDAAIGLGLVGLVAILWRVFKGESK